MIVVRLQVLVAFHIVAPTSSNLGDHIVLQVLLFMYFTSGHCFFFHFGNKANRLLDMVTSRNPLKDIMVWTGIPHS